MGIKYSNGKAHVDGEFINEIIRLIEEIEDKEPILYNFSRITEILKEYLQLEEIDQKLYESKIQHNITIKYEKYLVSKYNQKKFYMKLEFIQKLHDSESLTMENLFR